MRNKHKREEEETSYWLSYSDMMAALLLIFILIISFTILQSTSQYEEKQAELEQQQEVIKEQQEQLDKLIGIRKELIEALKEEFDGTDMSINVDEKTGSIALDSSILFDSGQAVLKQSGESLLKKFIPKYIVCLRSDFIAFQKLLYRVCLLAFGQVLESLFVLFVIIEGHTDSEGDYLYNLELSQKRALSVSSYCLNAKNAVLSESKIKGVRDMITANGKSFSNPVLDTDGKEDRNASRRVEFLFRLKDEDMINQMSDVLSE